MISPLNFYAPGNNNTPCLFSSPFVLTIIIGFGEKIVLCLSLLSFLVENFAKCQKKQTFLSLEMNLG
jgi:hypothetical protein